MVFDDDREVQIWRGVSLATTGALPIDQPIPFVVESMLQVSTLEAPVLSPDGRAVAYVRRCVNETDTRVFVTMLNADPVTLDLGPGSTPAWAHGRGTLAELNFRHASYNYTASFVPTVDPTSELSAEIFNKIDRQRTFTVGESHYLLRVERGAFVPGHIGHWVQSPSGKSQAILIQDLSSEQAYYSSTPAGHENRLGGITAQGSAVIHDDSDGAGWLGGRTTRLWVEGVIDRIESVTPGSRRHFHHRSITEFTWSPDDDYVAFLGNLTDASIDQPGCYLYAIDVNTGHICPLTGTRRRMTNPIWLPDGRIAVLTLRPGSEEDVGRFMTPALLSIGDPTDAKAQTSIEYLSVAGNAGQSPLTSFGSHETPAMKHVPGPDGSAGALYVLVERGSRSEVVRVALDAAAVNAPQPVTTPGWSTRDFDVNNDYLAEVQSSPTVPSRLVVRQRDGEPVLDMACDLSQFSLVTPEDITLTRRYRLRQRRIQSKLWLPPGAGPHPVKLWIHGGPSVQVGDAFFDDPQILASMGIATLAVNGAGSTGQDEKYTRGVVRRWRKGPGVGDIAAGRDYIDVDPRLDGSRVALSAPSYGPFPSLLHLARHASRYRGVVIERPVIDVLAKYFGGDDVAFSQAQFGSYDTQRLAKESVLPSLFRLRTKSRFALRKDVTLPPIIITSPVEDLRASPDQARRLFNLLRHGRHPATLWRLLGGNHDITRTGTRDQKLTSMRLITDFLHDTLCDPPPDQRRARAYPTVIAQPDMPTRGPDRIARPHASPGSTRQ